MGLSVASCGDSLPFSEISRRSVDSVSPLERPIVYSPALARFSWRRTNPSYRPPMRRGVDSRRGRAAAAVSLQSRLFTGDHMAVCGGALCIHCGGRMAILRCPPCRSSAGCRTRTCPYGRPLNGFRRRPQDSPHLGAVSLDEVTMGSDANDRAQAIDWYRELAEESPDPLVDYISPS